MKLSQIGFFKYEKGISFRLLHGYECKQNEPGFVHFYLINQDFYGLDKGNKNISLKDEIASLRTSIQKLSNNRLFTQVYGDLLNELTSLLKRIENSYQYYNLLTDASDDIIFRIGTSGEILLISNSCTDMLGYDQNELIGEPLNKIFRTDRGKNPDNPVKFFFKEDQVARFDGIAVHKNGNEIPVEISGKKISIEEEQVFQGSIKNTVQYIQYQLQLAAKDNTIKKIFEESLDGMRLTDEDGIVQLCNKAFADIVGKKKYEIEQFPFTIIFNSSEQELIKEYKNDFSNKSFQPYIETTYALWNGNYKYLEISNSFIEIDEKILLLSVFRDVTEKKYSENLLMKKDLLFQANAEITRLIHSSPDPDKNINTALKIIGTAAGVDRAYICKHRVNDETGEMYISLLYEWTSGSTEPQINHPMFKKLSYSRFSALDFFEHLSVGRTLKFIVNNLSPNEQQVFVDQNLKSIIITPIIADGSYLGFIALDDCTIDREWAPNEESLLSTFAYMVGSLFKRNQNQEDLSKLRSELNEALKNADTSERTKSEFLALMGHEIRTPMNGIIGMAGLLKDSGLDDMQKEYIETIQFSCDKLLSVINDILDYSKMESGGFDLENKPFDLRDCIEESLDQFASEAAEKKIDLAYLIESSTPVAINGDITRIRQILTNLLSYSIKFTEKGEVFISVSAKPIEKDKYEILFSLRDTGKGIPKERIERLFKPFGQSDSSQLESGLGLAISKKLCEMMNGRMWVESKEGKGTKFHFTVTAESVSSVSKVYLRGKSQQLKDKKILIVDDNDTNRKILMSQVEIWGMKYKATDNPTVALNWLREGEFFDIAIIDYNMPMMNGMMMSEEIKKISGYSDMPVIILTSFGKQETLTSGSKENADSIITKPIKHSQLQEYIIHNLAKAPKKPSQVIKEKMQEQDEPGNKYPLNILICEDNAVNQKSTKRILEKLGYKVDIASNGQEAVASAKNKKYDIILMDILMPEMNGYEASKIIRKEIRKNDQPVIIAMTANSLKESEKEFKASGMNDFIEKPVNLNQMKKVISGWSESIYRKKQNEFFDKKGEPSMIDFNKIATLHDIQTEDDLSFLKELIDTYINDLPVAAQDLASYVEKEDCKMIKFIAHKLKGGSITVGIDYMTDLTRKIEESVKGGKVTEETRVLTVNLIEACDPLLEELKHLKEKYIQV